MLGGPDSTNFLLVVVQEAIQLLNLRQTILAKEESDLVGGLKEGGFDVPFRHSSGFKQMCGCGRIEEKEGEGESLK